MHLPASEFIQNINGSVYHLNLLPEHLATTVITVGDPDRVAEVTKYFDNIEFTFHNREFHTQTGAYKGKRITVISTGIGTDNIDIVLNELDTLVNVDFKNRKIKQNFTSLDIIRIGTSGSIQKDIPLNTFVVSESAVGFDSLLHFYECGDILNSKFSEALVEHLRYPEENGTPYVINSDPILLEKFSDGFHQGVTLTNCGFYGPQGRVLRLQLKDPGLNEKLESFRYSGKKITNLEMETSGIYGLSKLLGHRAISLNAIVANRATGEFSSNPKETVDALIRLALERIIS